MSSSGVHFLVQYSLYAHGSIHSVLSSNRGLFRSLHGRVIRLNTSQPLVLGDSSLGEKIDHGLSQSSLSNLMSDEIKITPGPKT